MNDNELFELCKQVYEATGWDYQNGAVYTSDYLLEKLPKKVEGADWSYWLTLSPMDGESWDADYEFEDTEPRHFEYADTPLKALLKLTLALHEAGVLVREKQG